MFSYFYNLKFTTVKLAKYLHELLLENETVIYPGFGAFISNYKPAEIKENEIIPPSKVISFTRQFRNNDGLLVIHIARRAKISQTYATKRIDKERENMQYLLDKGEKVIIENVGILYTDEKNEIQFTSAFDENSGLGSFGFEPVTTKEAEIKPVEAEKITHEIQKPEPEITETFETSKNISTGNDILTTESDKKSEISKPEMVTTDNVKKKKPVWFWLLVFLISVVVIALLFFIISRDSGKSRKPSVREQISAEQQISVQTIMPSGNEKKDTAKNVTNSSVLEEINRYYIVGGAFKTEENVDKYIVKLRNEKGIEGKLIGKKGSMFLVSIASFNTEQEAYNELNRRMRENPEWKLWVYKK